MPSPELKVVSASESLMVWLGRHKYNYTKCDVWIFLSKYEFVQS